MRLVPERLLGQVLPRAYRFDPRELPPAPQAPAAPRRLYITPANFAGQGWQWAHAITEHVPDAAAVNMAVRSGDGFAHPTDYSVPLGFYTASRRWQRRERDIVSRGFTHVLVEAERHPFGAVLDETVSSQVRRLIRHGVGVVMLCHGTDIRLPSRHAAANPDSPFLGSLAEAAPSLERVAARNRRLLDELGLPVLVTTPDLILDVPYAHWLPSIIEPERWATASGVLQRTRPVVVHAPSSAATKGSQQIDPILSRLDAEGVISYRRVFGVPFSEMPGLYADSDIVVDQISFGDYGVVALEAMAAGRVVVSHVSPHARSQVLGATGFEVPVVEATAARLDEVVRGIVTDRQRYREVARQAVDFVTEIHDGRRSAGILAEYLR
ncbi:hypothetical protein BKA04_000889 [Cryobacterium mesophilum]|uniref:Glycosyltransferase family 1 protein n=1 Tax=Terrimesophilobacter mesophilus TaxID=433647 RepID=A0A4R8VAV7_9MICO|nr:glycosyltransferase [Terrimesophilobacter mesophilus]MBB5632666.1 hypothetical protein [Terrimesophilobacter mesophilus]TFB79476.1 glycosyltransferase family 1 protein [Terrimesophilobacter mesophilus]